MRKFIYTVLLIALGSCILPNKPTEDIKQRIARRVEMLLDSGYFASGKNGVDCYSKNGHAVTVLTRQS